MSGSKKNTAWLTMLGATLLASLFWGGLAQLDPLGVKSAANFHSESIFLRLIGGPWYQSAAQNEITVVLIDDNYLEQINSPWPMSYLDQDLLLSAILDYKPRAVFLDLLYRQKHENDGDISQLVQTIGQAAEGTIFIPYLINDMEGVNTCLPGARFKEDIVQKNSVIREMQDSSAIETYIGWKGCGNRYPALVVGDKKYKTPAFALYEKRCLLTGDNQPDSCTFLHPMMIRWGTGVSDDHKTALEKAGIECKSIDKNSLKSKLKYSYSQLSTALGQSFASTSERGMSERCTYTDTVHATWLLGASDENRAFLEKMLVNRIVLIGTQLDGVHDTVISPVNGKLPGVYLFAMALDNYLEYGSDYYRPMTNVARAAIEISVLWFITFSMGVLGRARKPRKFFPAVIIYKVGLPIIFSLLVAVIMWKYKFAPMDWIGVSLLSFFANPIKTEVYLKKKGRKYIPSIAGKTSVEGGIWEDILSWLRFLLRRLLSVQMSMQIRKR